ncbi:MAG TPA: hypothetical protein PKJ41_06355, partial [Bryobacteraceae bacterium]|nr:hypothetical protein [Bryobacteraceae bacterium]
HLDAQCFRLIAACNRASVYDPHFRTHTFPVLLPFFEPKFAKLKKLAQKYSAITSFNTYNATRTMVIEGTTCGL